MPLTLNREVFITCAVTGSGSTQDRSPHVPRSPKQIAESAIDAAKAGAAIVHCHVRDPETGAPSRDLALYREVTERIRDSEVDVVLNLTAGMGGDIIFGGVEAPFPTAKGTDMIGATERVAHVAECLPEICTLDCGSLNFGEGSLIYVSTPDMLRAGAKRIQELGVKPELEIFDTGQLWFVSKLIEEGLIDNPALIQLCLGVAWGSPCDTGSMKNMVEHLPAGANWASFGLGADQMPMVAQAALLGGHVRVGLEDNLYLERKVGNLFYLICFIK